MIEIAHVIGTQAVIKSPHFERLTPRVSRRGLVRILDQRTTIKKVVKKSAIIQINKNHSQ